MHFYNHSLFLFKVLIDGTNLILGPDILWLCWVVASQRTAGEHPAKKKKKS